MPVHFSIYYLGYLLALWFWRHHQKNNIIPQAQNAIKKTVITALIMAASIVIAIGIVQTIIKNEFPGVTWFIVRLAVSFPFILGWWAVVGRGRTSFVTGGILLAFLLAAYTNYLAPIGLSNPSLRIFDLDAPPANVHWLSYQDEFLLILPIMMVISLLSFYAGNQYLNRQLPEKIIENKIPKTWTPGTIASLVIILVVGIIVFKLTGSEAHRTTITSSGPAIIGTGQFSANNNTGVTADLIAYVENVNDHRTPLPPHDQVDIDATITDADGNVWKISANQPFVSDPQGRYTTWSGVGYDVWHHGRSGIGDSTIPATHSDVAIYALGDISFGSKQIASAVPIHLMTTEREGERLQLFVGDPSFSIADVPDGHFRVTFSDYKSDYNRNFDYAKYAWGSTWLFILLIWIINLVRAEEQSVIQIEKNI